MAMNGVPGGEAAGAMPDRGYTAPGFDPEAIAGEIAARHADLVTYVQREANGYELHRRVGVATMALRGVDAAIVTRGAEPGNFVVGYPRLHYDPLADTASSYELALGEYRYVNPSNGRLTVAIPYLHAYRSETANDDTVPPEFSYTRGDLTFTHHALQGTPVFGQEPDLYQIFLGTALNSPERRLRIDQQTAYLGWLSGAARFLGVSHVTSFSTLYHGSRRGTSRN